jgi:neopullulanase
MKRLKIFNLLFFFLVVIATTAQEIEVYPTHWWVGMKNVNLQLIVHGKDIASKFPQFKLSPAGLKCAEGITLKSLHRAENPNYVFLNLSIAQNAKPGLRQLDFIGIKIPYELKRRRAGNGTQYAQGVTQKDFIYLLMPDRFANGDTSNDSFRNMRDTLADRNNPFDRHGGDLLGIVQHLDYLKELGITTLWPTPVVENDMSRTMEGGTSRSTYHGYAFTNQYAVDKRLGGNEAYHRLSNELHKRGMKLIQDAVYNHLGNDHWSVRDLPMKDWLNQWSSYQNTSYRDQPLIDPYAADIDRAITVRGSFTPFLVDLNQRNIYVQNFLIQYAIWTTEEFGVDGWRVDTYFYNEPEFLNKINNALIKEFPSITIFGEATAQTVLNSAYYVQNNYINIPFRHNTQGVTDFPLQSAMLDGLKQPVEGMNRLYNTLTQDMVYKNPFRNCIFLDNHDQDRMYSVIGEDFDKFKMGINWLLTLRGIPQLYYGTEILMKNFKNPTDAEVRKDFPGGWSNDAVNKFKKEGRTVQEEEAWIYISKLALFRKNSSALTTGKLMQYLPENGIYAYFRYDANQTIMVISYTGKDEIAVKADRFEQRTKGFTRMRNVITGDITELKEFAINSGQSYVMELLK